MSSFRLFCTYIIQTARAVEPPEKILLGKPTLAKLALLQVRMHFDKKFWEENRGWWLFLYIKGETFCITLTLNRLLSKLFSQETWLFPWFKIQHVWRFQKPYCILGNVWFFYSRHFFLRQLAVIIGTMINFRTPICAYRASILSTVQTQATR